MHLNVVVPTVTCSAEGQQDSFWVGLDGFSGRGIPVPNNRTVEQVGVLTICDIRTSNGSYKPHYYSFWEMYPYVPNIGSSVSPGDTIAVSVYYDSATQNWNLALNDSNSTAADISTSQPCPAGSTCHNVTAEVIAEDPGGGPPKGVYLAEFSTVHFSQVAVTSRNGTHGTLEGNSLWSANESTMAYGGITMAQPSGRTDGYTAFSDTWKDVG